uniref:LRRCT domain-containing protein n=1 Tax=Panagrellus redivivus TaxID=6233 RepID=A0A7E4UP67_PANRE
MRGSRSAGLVVAMPFVRKATSPVFRDGSTGKKPTTSDGGCLDLGIGLLELREKRGGSGGHFSQVASESLESRPNATMILLCSILWLLAFIKGNIADTECISGVQLTNQLESCSCASLGVEGHVALQCHNQKWITVPNIDKGMQGPHKESTYIAAISFKNGFLMYISQDAFRNTSAQTIDLSRNFVESINVNAFRGLEDNLYQLLLTQNSLQSIPYHSLTYLRQLRYLYLQQNQINEITAQTFAGTQLQNLKYLHMDKNQLSILPKGALTHLPIQVFTASNNRISEVEKESLPTTLWFLDLKHNLLNRIPYLALKELKNLKTLDLESNNITSVETQTEVRFETEITLLLSNNKVQKLQAHAFNSFAKLEKLDLSYNQVSQVDETAFAKTSSLKELDLSYNAIVHIPAKTFEHQASTLKKLNLEENDLHTVPSGLRVLQALEVLNLNSNKLAE